MNTVVFRNGTAGAIRASAAYRYYVLGVLILVCVFSWVDRQIFGIVLESIKGEFHFSDTQLGLLGGVAFGLFYAAVGLPVAWIADRFSRRNIVAFSLAAWSAMTALCGLSSGFTSLFLARMGVGIGEAGGSAPSQSLVSDYFPRDQRGLAMSVLYLFVPIGFVVAYAAGGTLDQQFGWRMTFVIVGLPGVALALLCLLTVREPPRGCMDRAEPVAETPSLLSTIRYFLSRRSLRHLPLAGAVHGIGGFGVAVWMPAYFIRTHGMTSAQIGLWLAVIMGCAGLLGTLCGGYLADRLSARFGSPQWYVRLPAFALLASLPFNWLVYSWSTASGALLFYAVPVFCNHMLLGPVVATTQNLVGPRRRTVAAAFYLFLVNLISMGLGPLLVGVLSDFFGARYGNQSLRLSLMILTLLSCSWAAVHLLCAGRSLRTDLEAAAREARGA